MVGKLGEQGEGMAGGGLRTIAVGKGDISGAGAQGMPGAVEGELAADAVEELVLAGDAEMVGGGMEVLADFCAGADQRECPGARGV
jgi:hypothetical protein